MKPPPIHGLSLRVSRHTTRSESNRPTRVANRCTGAPGGRQPVAETVRNTVKGRSIAWRRCPNCSTQLSDHGAFLSRAHRARRRVGTPNDEGRNPVQARVSLHSPRSCTTPESISPTGCRRFESSRGCRTTSDEPTPPSTRVPSQSPRFGRSCEIGHRISLLASRAMAAIHAAPVARALSSKSNLLECAG